MSGLVVLLSVIIGGSGFIAWMELPHMLLLLAATPLLGAPRARRRLRHRRCLRNIADLETEFEMGPVFWALEPGSGDYGYKTYHMPFHEREFRRALR